MSRDDSPGISDLESGDARRVDALCDEFERCWSAGAGR